MNYVFVQDSEGYVFKKLESEMTADETQISEAEYMEISGLASYVSRFEIPSLQDEVNNAPSARYRIVPQR